MHVCAARDICAYRVTINSPRETRDSIGLRELVSALRSVADIISPRSTLLYAAITGEMEQSIFITRARFILETLFRGAKSDRYKLLAVHIDVRVDSFHVNSFLCVANRLSMRVSTI